MLVGQKLRTGIGSGEPQKTYQRYSGPLKAAGPFNSSVVGAPATSNGKTLLGAIRRGCSLVPGCLELSEWSG